ncbi:hypothetical protein HHI36_005770 [Cryptolaemus montrouzieri]|uniref:Uncharacterized protein n=1 Tax=Cryptolaemus montrouzieri TaxID=559131 RepID=A0ABD2NVE0_9CUCU
MNMEKVYCYICSKVVELMSSAVRDLSESEFIGLRDSQNNPLPSPPKKEKDEYSFQFSDDPLEPVRIEDALGNAQAEWTLRNILEAGSLLGKSCQGTLKLAGHSSDLQEQAYRFGRHIALAWQACLERQPFISGSAGPFSLVSAPVLFTLEYNHGLYAEIEKGYHNINDVDFDEIRRIVLEGPGLELTKKLQSEHSDMSFEFLRKLPDTEARNAILNILAAME